MSQGENDYEKDLQHLTSTIAGKIDEGAQKIESFFSSACIFRVPEYLRKLNEEAYTPRLIAVGPLHREDEHLQIPLQHVKTSYMKYLLSRLTAGIEDLELAKQAKSTVLQKCAAEMKTSIDDAKKCYAVEVKLDEEMLLVDGCFILELFYRKRLRYLSKDRAKEEGKKPINGNIETHRNSKGQNEADPIFCNRLVTKVGFDLLLLENQIPFFVLEKLFQLTVDQIPDRPDKDWSLTNYVLDFFEKLSLTERSSTNVSSSGGKTWCSPSDCVLGVFGSTTEAEEVQSGGNIDHRNAKYYHILHKVHDVYPPRHQTKAKVVSLNEMMSSASELAYAGVKFVPITAENMLEVNFTEPEGLFGWYGRARYKIPLLEIYDSTESFLRNLIAFEQCCPGVSQHVSSYATLMDMLVKSDKDVKVLEKAGVLKNWLGATKDATDLFNNLCKHMYFGDYFSDTCIEATQYSKRFWPKNMALLRRTYFASPWTFIAFCVGFMAFIMSFVQFIRDFL